jgi:peptidoglycan/xylan/chitin deacetylase (PgdA/CDA1 family)
LEKHGFQGWFFIPVDLVAIPASEQPAAAARHDVLHDCDTAQDPRVFMTSRQVAAIAESHVVGCHTATHVRLSRSVSEMDLGAELGRAKQRLEAFLGGRRVDSFSWVGGEEWAYSEPAAQIVARLFDYAFTTNTCVARAGTPQLNICRTHIEPFFSHSLVRLQLSGMMDLYYRSKRRRLRSSLAPCSRAAAFEG